MFKNYLEVFDQLINNQNEIVKNFKLPKIIFFNKIKI